MGGLMGNYNDVESDDLVSRNGQIVPADSNEERIYHDFGETCELHIISYELKLHVLCYKREYNKYQCEFHLVTLLFLVCHHFLLLLCCLYIIAK